MMAESVPEREAALEDGCTSGLCRLRGVLAELVGFGVVGADGDFLWRGSGLEACVGKVVAVA